MTKIYKLDYSKTQTENDLLSWARSTFELEDWKKPLIKNKEVDTVIWQIWDKLVKMNQKEINVLESYPRHLSKEVHKIMEGSDDQEDWKAMLGFHFYLEHLIHVCFSQNPETKGKRPKRTHNG